MFLIIVHLSHAYANRVAWYCTTTPRCMIHSATLCEVGLTGHHFFLWLSPDTSCVRGWLGTVFIIIVVTGRLALHVYGLIGHCFYYNWCHGSPGTSCVRGWLGTVFIIIVVTGRLALHVYGLIGHCFYYNWCHGSPGTSCVRGWLDASFILTIRIWLVSQWHCVRMELAKWAMW